MRGKVRSQVKVPCDRAVLLETTQINEKDTEQTVLVEEAAPVANSLNCAEELQSTILGMLLAANLELDATNLDFGLETEMLGPDAITSNAVAFRPPPGLEVSAEEDEAEKCQDGVPLCTNFSSRRVAFDFDANTIHEITPYSEIYGLHPREFVFDRHFFMVPSSGDHGFCGIGSESDDVDEDDCEDCASDLSDDEDGEWVEMNTAHSDEHGEMLLSDLLEVDIEAEMSAGEFVPTYDLLCSGSLDVLARILDGPPGLSLAAPVH